MKTIRELMSLENRVALITGGTGHLGMAFAETFAELGARVALLDLDDEKCRQCASDLSGQWKVDVMPLPLDLNHEAELKKAPARIVEHFKRLDILVNCAALGGATPLSGWAVPFEEQSSETWRKALEVNLTAGFVLAQASAPALRLSGKGSIINIGSIYGMLGPDMRLYDGTAMGNPAAYGVSKGGLLQLTRWLATVLAPDIRVNMISCGGVERGQPSGFQSQYVYRTPMKRMGAEEDFKGAAAFLAGDLSAYVTGQNFVVDGGWSAW